MRETERQRHRQREKQALRQEPDAGLDPRIPGPHPGPKAGAKPLSHLGILIYRRFLKSQRKKSHKKLTQGWKSTSISSV